MPRRCHGSGAGEPNPRDEEVRMKEGQLRTRDHPRRNRCDASSSQQELDGTSLKTQEEQCRQYATAHSLTVYEAQVYRDVFSGAVLHDRPQLTALRRAVREGSIDVVISYAVDRLSRNQAHLYILAEEWEGAGVQIHFVTESFEDSAVGRFMRSAKAFAAEVEREKFVERSVRGKRDRVASGKLLHGKTPLYGYEWADESKAQYVINPTTAPVARRMFVDALSGRSLRSIAAALTAEGVSTPRGAAVWDPGPSGISSATRHTRARRTPFASSTRGSLERADRAIPNDHATSGSRCRKGPSRRSLTRTRLQPFRASSGAIKSSPPADFVIPNFIFCVAATSDADTAGTRWAHAGTSLAEAPICLSVFAPKSCSGHVHQPWHRDRDARRCRLGQSGAHPYPARLIARELETLYQDDPTEAERAALDRALSALARKRANLARSLALFDDVEAAAPVVAQLEALRDQEKVLQAERETMMGRRDAWAAGSSNVFPIYRHWRSRWAPHWDSSPTSSAGRRWTHLMSKSASGGPTTTPDT